MDYTQQIISLLKKAQKEEYRASVQFTLEFAQEYREVSDHPELIDKLIALITIYKKQERHIHSLSERESQLFNLIGLGFKSKEIASMLKISEATVSTHRKNIIRKLQISGLGKLQTIAMQYNQDQ